MRPKTPVALGSLRRDPNLPILHGHSYVRRYQQSTRRLHSCCCWYHLAPANSGISPILYYISLSLFLAYLNILICHSNIIRVCLQIFRCGHHCELDGPLVAEGFVGPFSYRSNLFYRSDTVVSNKHLDHVQYSFYDWTNAPSNIPML